MSSLREKQPGANLPRILFYEAIRRSAHVLLAVFFRAQAVDVENVPGSGPLLLAANHQSYLDPPTIGSLVTHRHLEFIARAGLFKYRPFAWVISLLNSIPIREDTGDAQAVREVLRRLEKGRAVLIFPEGSRTPDGKIHTFKRGVALLVKRARCPVVPVAIEGAYQRWPRFGWPRLVGPPVIVRYGKPIPYEELMKEGADAAMRRLEKEVRLLHSQITGNGAASSAGP
jgi:1-acyl-sn-glycerol-3-phosphate acyltransferase